MKQPEQIYKQDHTAENVKIIEDYTAEKCLYYIQKYCIKHADCFGCTFFNRYGQCDIMQEKIKPYEWRLTNEH